MRSNKVDLSKITHRLHDHRAKLAPSLLLRKNYLTTTFLAQIQAEKDAINSRIDRLQPGLKKVYFKHRLERLNARALRKPTGL